MQVARAVVDPMERVLVGRTDPVFAVGEVFEVQSAEDFPPQFELGILCSLGRYLS